jgi:hypothetical protein
VRAYYYVSRRGLAYVDWLARHKNAEPVARRLALGCKATATETARKRWRPLENACILYANGHHALVTWELSYPEQVEVFEHPKLIAPDVLADLIQRYIPRPTRRLIPHMSVATIFRNMSMGAMGPMNDPKAWCFDSLEKYEATRSIWKEYGAYCGECYELSGETPWNVFATSQDPRHIPTENIERIFDSLRILPENYEAVARAILPYILVCQSGQMYMVTSVD